VATSQQIPAKAVMQVESADARCCEDYVAHAVGALSADSGIRLDSSASALRRYAAAILAARFRRCAIAIVSLHSSGPSRPLL
jgi:hypothetical protein